MKKTALAMALLCISHTGWGAPPTVAVNYRGELVAEPCVIPLERKISSWILAR